MTIFVCALRVACDDHAGVANVLFLLYCALGREKTAAQAAVSVQRHDHELALTRCAVSATFSSCGRGVSAQAEVCIHPDNRLTPTLGRAPAIQDIGTRLKRNTYRSNRPLEGHSLSPARDVQQWVEH